MFHPDIVARRVRRLEQRFGVKLYRYTTEESRYVTTVQLENKRNPKTGKLEHLTADEQLFIQNEILMSRADFVYWLERYPKLILDDATGELGHPKLWNAQQIMLSRLAEQELKMWREWEQGHKRFEGNKWYVHKARQMGLTSICQGINVHGVNFYSYTSCLVGSKNLPKTQDSWRDYGRLMWSTQPDWMMVPSLKDHSEHGIVLANGSKVILQHSEQESGFGQGAKWHRSHLTEVASWNENRVGDHIDNHFGPSISASIKSCAFLESTSQGMDNYWHLNTERARAGKLEGWRYLFIGWYLTPDLNYAPYVPDDWNPRPETLAEEELIIRTSPEFNDGKAYYPTLNQMYWWEKKRAELAEKQELNEFYKNYPSIPEQSFTHSGRSSFPYEVLAWCDTQARDPYAFYEVLTDATPSSRIRTEREIDKLTGKLIDPPPIYEVGNMRIGPVHVTDEEKVSPLGLILAWESPKEVSKFEVFGGVDTTGGIEGWSRHLRRKDDDDINNACISLIRSGNVMDTDVIEFAAPITPKPLAAIYNTIARVWIGRNALDGQTPTIVELTGEGLAFQEELISEHNFFNFYQHFRFNGGSWDETQQFGWVSSPKSIRHLWALFKSHVTEKNYIPRSKYLIREMRSCTDDQIYVAGMTRGKAPKTAGRHDDRVYSRAFALWFSNSWANPEPKPERAQQPRTQSEGKRKLKLHEMDFQSQEEKEQWIADWEARILGESGYY